MVDFTLDISKFVAKAKGNADLVVRKATLEMFKKIVIKSPVDTGRFKSNWQAAVGSVPSGTIGLERSVTHSDDGKERDRGAARDAAAGSATFARVNAVALSAKAGTVVYLVNNLHYANELEYGHSTQAPNGMVRISILEWNAAVSRAAGEVR